MIQSMTRKERRDVDLLNNSRRRRVAAGSGTTTKDISGLVKGFGMMQQMSKQMSGMGMMSRMKAMRGMGGVDPAALGDGMPGMGRKGSTKQKPKFKQRKRRR
jgi:signal recognition particle subunit SRP54